MRLAIPARWAFAVVVAALAVLFVVSPALASAGPDGRGYELVSPALKDGGDLIVDSSRVHAASSQSVGAPMAATFALRNGVGDAAGAALSSEYLSERDGQPGTSGWSVHAISPPQRSMSLKGAISSLEAAYLGDLSPDLSTGVLQAWSPLTSDPNVAATENLYVRRDLRSPGAGAYQLLTTCPLCASAGPLPAPVASTNSPVFAGASADFSHVIFESTVNLTSDASGSDMKLYEWANGSLRLFSGPGNAGCATGPCSAAGIGARSFLAPHVVSTDGSRVIFTSPINFGDDTPQGGTDANAAKIYEFDDHGTANPSDDTLVQVNASERTDCAGDPTCGGNGIPDPAPATPMPANYEDASSDGSRVFFTTTEPLTDGAPNNGVAHLYMWSRTPDAQGNHLTLLDVDNNSGDAGEVSGVVGVSADGHFVYFVAINQLVNDPTLPLHQRSLYLWRDDGGTVRVRFIGYFANLSDPHFNIHPLLAEPKTARVTPDGRHVLFEASDGTGLTGYDHGDCSTTAGATAGPGCSEVYVYSADANAGAGSLVCASCNPSGAPGTGNAFVTLSAGVRPVGAGFTISTNHLSHPISDDGKRVFFSTSDALVAGDVNGRQDVYEYDTQDGSVHLVSSGRDSSDSWFMDASADGSDVFFATRERLVGWDVDDNYDLYDARIGGGFPDPPTQTECAGDTCRGSGGGSPAALVPGGSALLTGSANVKAATHRKAKPKRCRRGFVRKRVQGRGRCVKRRVPQRHSVAHGRRHAAGR